MEWEDICFFYFVAKVGQIKKISVTFLSDHRPLIILPYDGVNYGQLTDGPTRRRIKSSRDVGELVVNPIQLIRS